MNSIQKQVLIGSLLGDGHLSCSSKRSARFSEGHCLKQKDYLDWKVEVFGDYISSYYPIRKGEFKGFGFTTKSNAEFLEFYHLFYVNGVRVFPSKLVDLMTPLVLSVWFMDDGSVTKKKAPRISFGLDDLSLERSFAALKVLGLNPVCYGKGSDRTIMFPKQEKLFGELVKPYLLPCFDYKLPMESASQARFRKTNQVTATEVKRLSSEFSVREIAELLGIGVSTVRRRLKHET